MAKKRGSKPFGLDKVIEPMDAFVECPDCGYCHRVPMNFTGWFTCRSCQRRVSWQEVKPADE